MHIENGTIRASRRRMAARVLIAGLLSVVSLSVLMVAQSALAAGPTGGPGAPVMTPAPKPAPISQAPIIPNIPTAVPNPGYVGTPNSGTAGAETSGKSADGATTGDGTNPGPSQGSQDVINQGLPITNKQIIQVLTGSPADRSESSSDDAIFDRWGNLIYRSSDGDSGRARTGLPSSANRSLVGFHLPGVAVTVKKSGNGGVKMVAVDDTGKFALGKLGPGSYAIGLGGLSRALSAPGSGDQGKGRPPIIGILIALLLPAVQPARDEVVPTSSCTGCFPNSLMAHQYRITKDASTLTEIKFTIAKGGRVETIDWGDGTPAIKLGREGKADFVWNVQALDASSAPKDHDYRGTISLVEPNTSMADVPTTR